MPSTSTYFVFILYRTGVQSGLLVECKVREGFVRTVVRCQSSPSSPSPPTCFGRLEKRNHPLPYVVTRSEGAFMSVGPRALHNLPRLLQTSTPRRRREVDCPPWYSRFSRRNAHRDAFRSDRCRFRRETLLFCLDISNMVGKWRMNRSLSPTAIYGRRDM